VLEIAVATTERLDHRVAMTRPVLLALLATTLTASAAHADDLITDPLDLHAPGTEPDGYVSAGIVVDANNGYISKGPVVEIGARLGQSAWFARGMFQGGSMVRSDEPGQGTFGQGSVGIEGRNCGRGGTLCGSAGVDVGFLRGDFDHVTFSNNERVATNEQFNAYLAVPRVTLDAGGRIRFRAVLELPVQMRTSSTSMPTTALRSASMQNDNTSDTQFQLGAAFSLSLSVGF
jgi:hypothetical protein